MSERLGLAIPEMAAPCRAQGSFGIYVKGGMWGRHAAIMGAGANSAEGECGDDTQIIGGDEMSCACFGRDNWGT